MTHLRFGSGHQLSITSVALSSDDTFACSASKDSNIIKCMFIINHHVDFPHSLMQGIWRHVRRFSLLKGGGKTIFSILM